MKKKLIVFLFFILIMTSCSPPVSSILSDNSCDVPCWRGITPGESTKDEVLEKISLMIDIDGATIIETGGNFRYWQNGVGWEFSDVIERDGAIFFHDNKVVFFGANINSSVTLSEIISKYGDPDDIYATYGELESMMKNITMVYSEGICIEISTRKTKVNQIDTNSDIYSVDISASEKVKVIEFFDPNLTPSEINTSCYWPIDESLIQQWKGYGIYNMYRNLP